MHVTSTNVRYYTSSLDRMTVHVTQRVLSRPCRDLPSCEAGVALRPRPLFGNVEGSEECQACQAESEAAAQHTEGTPLGDEECDVHFGRVKLRLEVSAYVKIWQKTGEIFEEVCAGLAAR